MAICHAENSTTAEWCNRWGVKMAQHEVSPKTSNDQNDELLTTQRQKLSDFSSLNLKTLDPVLTLIADFVRIRAKFVNGVKTGSTTKFAAASLFVAFLSHFTLQCDAD